MGQGTNTTTELLKSYSYRDVDRVLFYEHLNPKQQP